MNKNNVINNISDVNFTKIIDDRNNILTNIFANVKSQNWKNVVKIIKSIDDNNDFGIEDLNIKDASGTYLLEYAIMFNQTELIDLLLKKDVRIDILDDNSRSILYNVIKFSHTDILVKILEKNKNSIGKSVLEIKDNMGNIPLFYSIKFFNIDCAKIILEYTNNFYIKNIEGDNALHLSIKSQNFLLFKLILEKFTDFKSRNNVGESYLHLIIKYKCYDMFEYMIKKCNTDTNFVQMLNFVDYRYNFTILHYICIGIDYESLAILLKANLLKFIDGDIQDKSGNIFYHYFINNITQIQKLTPDLINNIIGMNEIFKQINFNINLYNIDGNTPAHLFFSSINFFSSSKLNVIINWIGEQCDMNLQNFEGESVFYIIVKNNYWKQISNVLVTKKLDIFVITENSSNIFDYIEKADYVEFIHMVTQSYINQLTNSSTSKKWLDYWDNRCKKIVKLGELNETELELVKNLGINYDENRLSQDHNICFDIIEKKLTNAVESFISTSKSQNISDRTDRTDKSSSFPMTHKFKKLIMAYPNVAISTFSGSTIDVLSGLIYLSDKFNNNTSDNNYKYLVSSIKLLVDKINIIECKSATQSYFNRQINKNNKVCEINGFEILWINKNIHFPTNQNVSIGIILKQMIKLNKENHQNLNHQTWFIIPIGIELGSNSHANYLIANIAKMEVERFEPHGSKPPVGLDYDADTLDFILEGFFDEFDLKYVRPQDYMANIGFQMKEISEQKGDYIGDPNGFCALWCIWWADLRLSNPEIPREKLFRYVTKELINGKYSYKKLIRDYSSYVINIRDKMFLKANTNINEWINDTIPDKNLELLDNAIRDEIKND